MEKLNLFTIIHKKIISIPEKRLIWWLVSLSALIAWRIMYIQHGWINDDSVLYFEVARLFSLGDWKAGLSLYDWAFYPALIAGVHKMTSASFQLSAQILNIAFFALTTFSFLSLIRIAGGNQLTIACGALLLFSTSYIVGDILPMLLRDQGFWAFFLTSIYYFIQYYRHQSFKSALLWQVYALIAVLFRVEAVTFFALLPLIFLVEKKHDGIKPWAISSSLGLLILATLLSIHVFHPTLTLTDFGRVNQVTTLLQQGFINMANGANAKASIISALVLSSFLEEYSMLVLLTGLFAILVIKCLFSAGWVSIALLVFKLRVAKKTIAPDALKIFYWVMALAVLNAALILLNVYVLSGRYVASLGFIILILAAFCLAHLITKAKKNRHKWVLTLVLVVLALTLISNILPKKGSLNYEQNAVAWIKQLEIPSGQRVFYVSPRARYYANAPYEGRGYEYWDYTQQAITNGTIYNYDYLVINLDVDGESAKKEMVLADKLPQYRLIHTVYGFKKKKRILIYKRQTG